MITFEATQYLSELEEEDLALVNVKLLLFMIKTLLILITAWDGLKNKEVINYLSQRNLINHGITTHLKMMAATHATIPTEAAEFKWLLGTQFQTSVLTKILLILKLT